MAIPLCSYFNKCGGCCAQHIDYVLQLGNKKKQVQRVTGREDVLVFSDIEYHYRNRMDFVFFSGGVGFREKGNSTSLVDVARCVISEEKLNVLLSEVHDFFMKVDVFNLYKKRGTFRYAVIRVTRRGDSSISIVLNADSSRLLEGFEKVRAFAKKTTAQNVVVTLVPENKEVSISDEFEVVKGSNFLEEELLGHVFRFSIQGFFQNNTVMAEKMQGYVHTLLGKYDTSLGQLLDLYCGVGTFGIINAGLFKEVVMVESVESAMDMAQENLKLNDVCNAVTHVLDARQLRKLKFGNRLFVITDPPRSGMDMKTIHYLNELLPEVIIYISCNAEQLARDLPKFKKYEVKSAALFDLFPQTNHCEIVVELVRIDETT